MNADSNGVQSDVWQQFRELMPVTQKWAYFDHAAVAPLPEPSHAAIAEWSEQAAYEGDTVWPEWEKRVGSLRKLAAELLAAEQREIAITPNTTTGISIVAEGFPWQTGDNVVTLANEFPSNQYPWMNLESRGVECRQVSVESGIPDLNRIMETCDERTKIISISWVGYASGYRIDVESFVKAAHERGILLFLDAIQGVGAFSIDVRQTGVDFLAADGHKWMLGPEGAGLFYMRAEHLELLRPFGVGWNSVKHSYDFANITLELKSSAARYEGGSQNMVGITGLHASLSTLAEFGLSAQSSPVGDRILYLNQLAAERLRNIGGEVASDFPDEHRSGILSVGFPGRDMMTLKRQCLEAGVVLNVREGKLRITPHAYINEEDIDRLVSALSA